MDFLLSMTIAGYLSTIFLFIGLGVYLQRLNQIQERLTKPTRRALFWFGIAGAAVGILGLTIFVFTEFVLVFLSFIYLAFSVSQLNLVVSSEKMLKRSTIVLTILAFAMTLDVILHRFIVLLEGTMFILVIGIIAFVAITFSLSIYLLKESPSSFTVSILIILILLLFAAVTAMGIQILLTPEYYIFLIAPFVITAGVMFSMMRPWRQIASYSIGIFAMINAIALAIPGYIDGNYDIVLFAIAAGFASICIIAPFDFFGKQALDTGAKTPVYITITLVFIALLSMTHSTNYAISIVNADVWDPTILYMDWIFGVFAVSTFTLASFSTTASEGMRNAAREILIALAAALVVLGNPIVMEGRWETELLYIVMIVLIVVSFIGFIRLTRQLFKLGSGAIAGRFLAFMFAALGMGLVTMFADEIGISVLFPTLIFAGLLLLWSNPNVIRRIRNREN